MRIISDKGTVMNRIHSLIGDCLANMFGQRLNYTLRYYSNRHRWPNFKNPKDLSERLLSAMLSPDFLQFADYADKVKVREYVVSKGLESILLKQYGSWEDPDLIQFDELPERFILKANNGSGGHYVCMDKSELVRSEVVSMLNESLQAVKHLRKTEPHYSYIKPMILAEELLGDGQSLPVDYKFHCINGKVADIFVVCERESKAKYCTLDTNWEQLPYTKPEFMPKEIPAKPKDLKSMVEIAEKLAEDFQFVRVDLYNNEGKIYFGELTFSPWGGIMNSYSNRGVDELGALFDK